MRISHSVWDRPEEAADRATGPLGRGGLRGGIVGPNRTLGQDVGRATDVVGIGADGEVG